MLSLSKHDDQSCNRPTETGRRLISKRTMRDLPMSSLRLFGLLLVVGLLSLSPAARADAPADDARFQAFDLAMARDYLLPRYQALAAATAAQEEGWLAFCRQPTADGFAAM